MCSRPSAEEQRADCDIVHVAVKRNWETLQYAAELLCADREAVREIMKHNGKRSGWLHYAAAELRADREIVLEAVKQNWKTPQHSAEELCADSETVLNTVKQRCEALRFAAADFRADREIVLEAVKQEWQAFEVSGHLSLGGSVQRPIKSEMKFLNGGLRAVDSACGRDENCFAVAPTADGSVPRQRREPGAVG
ncbi:DUF4116 domain-containing protein [bacterium]|nr:DUF4116 domain-containing protein [bacterium]